MNNFNEVGSEAMLCVNSHAKMLQTLTILADWASAQRRWQYRP